MVMCQLKSKTQRQLMWLHLIFCSLFCRLIANSECLEELDLEDNLIGGLGGREVMDALIDRKEGS